MKKYWFFLLILFNKIHINKADKMSNITIGRKILEKRQKKGYTIRDFSKKTGLSTSLLSQIERGIANPSVNALRSISESLDISLHSLFVVDIDNETLILRKKDRSKVYRENSKHIVFDILTPEYIHSNVNILWAILNPQSETTEGYMKHDKEEFAVVTKGKTYALIEDEEYYLEEGDIIRILPRMKHKFRNNTDDYVEILFILTSSSL